MYARHCSAIGQSATVTIRKISVKAGKHQRQGDLVGRALADGPFDQGDHAVEERFRRRRR